MISSIVVAVALSQPAAPIATADGYVADVKASLYVQASQRTLLPGANGAAVQPETIAAVYGYAFARITGVDLPWAKDALSAEVSAYGALGALDFPAGQQVDGDLQAAWVQHQTRNTRVKLGRQVTLPGAARYVRFDGASAAARLGPIEVSGYAGLVTLPRFGRPRGYFELGSVGDLLADPTVLELESRPGQWLAGALVSWAGSRSVHASVGFHEQRGPLGVAFRNLSADLAVTPLAAPISLGGRFVFDLHALAPAEAHAWVDLTAIDKLPLSLDYLYAAPALLLPHGSVLAAFGGASWHELGLDATWRATPYLRISGRLAGQLYVGSSAGARVALKAKWTPTLDGRFDVQAEYARVSAPDNGYNHLRLAARYLLAERMAASVDFGSYLYDVAVQGVRTSVTLLANLELPLGRHFKGLLTGQVASTPWARFDAGVFVRAVYEFDGPSAGGSF